MTATGPKECPNAIEDCIGQGWVADGFVPVLDGQLAGDDCRGAAVAVFEDFQEVAALGGGEDGEAPIVDNQHIHAGDGFEDAFVATVAAGKGEGFEHARGALIEDRSSIPACLVAKGTGDPALAQDRWARLSASSHGAGSSRHPQDAP